MSQRFYYGVFALNILIIVGFWWANSSALLGTGLGSTLITLGSLAGLVGAYLVLVQMLLIGRGRWLEPVFGLDKLARIHHYNGFVALSLIALHVFLMVIGYSLAFETPLFIQFIILLTDFQYVILAFIGFLMLVGIVFISIAIVRRKLKYETWYFVHFSVYLAIILAFWHQIYVGSTLLSQPIFRAYWIGLYIFTFSNTLLFRFFRPLWLLNKHQFTVTKVEKPTPNTTSVYITGKALEKFPIKPGQFNIYRFLDFKNSFIKEQHPFSLSFEPQPDSLRITAKAVGDYTAKLPLLKPGIKVLVDGPYGYFTPERTANDKLLFIAGGIGITPLRSMLGELVKTDKDLVLLYGARDKDELALKNELERLTAKGNLRIAYVLSEEQKPGYKHGYIDKELIKETVPDVAERDVYLCGPPPMMDAVKSNLVALGVSSSAVYTERFQL